MTDYSIKISEVAPSTKHRSVIVLVEELLGKAIYVVLPVVILGLSTSVLSALYGAGLTAGVMFICRTVGFKPYYSLIVNTGLNLFRMLSAWPLLAKIAGQTWHYLFAMAFWLTASIVLDQSWSLGMLRLGLFLLVQVVLFMTRLR
jgi:hypothetical protein